MAQARVLEVVERLMSAISILSFLIIVSTFLGFKSFNRKLFNRLVFYASFGNAASNVATMISQSGIMAGDKSGLCQLQGFLIQWFMPADALWAFCMALNVFFAFRTTRVSVNFHRLGLVYIVACYGIPLIPAVIYLGLDFTTDHGIYGQANLWCWISQGHESLRVATFYAPVWVIILLTAGFYTYTYRTFDKAEVLSHESEFHSDCPERIGSLDSDKSAHKTFGDGNEHFSSKMTEIVQYSEHVRSFKGDSRYGGSGRSTTTTKSSIGSEAQTLDTLFRPITNSTSGLSTHLKHDKESRKVARVTTYCYVDHNAKTNKPFRKRETLTDTTSRTDRGAKQYTLVAFVVFLALLIVWVPSTVNRVWGIANSNSVPFAMSLVAALVLPAQGFLNCVIYLFFSRAELRMEVSKVINGSGLRTGNADASNSVPSNEAVELAKGKKRQGSMYPDLECNGRDTEEVGRESPLGFGAAR